MPFLGLQPWHIIVVVIVALLIFGPKRLPDVGRWIGRTMSEFRTGTRELTEAIREESMKSADPTPPATTAPVTPPPAPVNSIAPPAPANTIAPPPLPADVKFCPKCGSSNQVDAVFCMKCGNQFPA